ncbi:WD40-repeat-containing domain protein [Cunninghamella echinulata]|nr:WD40-repeat-containing domain protein [Cunninghamella echinulata]
MMRMNLTPIFATYGSPPTSSYLNDQSIPTYIAIVNKKDGTTITKCLNPTSKRRRSSSSSAYPLKKQFSSTAFFLPKLGLYNKKRKRQSSIESNHINEKVLYNLPVEIIQTILYHLDYQSILTLSSTCKYVQHLCKDGYIWYTQFQHDFHTPKTLFSPNQYLTLYQNHYLLTNRWLDGKMKTQYLQGHQGSVYCLTRLNATQFISGSRDRTLRVWQMKQEQEQEQHDNTKPIITKKTIHQGSILCLKVSSNLMITGSSDATCALWDTRTLTLLTTFKEHHHGVLDVCFLSSSSLNGFENEQDSDIVYFASASRDHTICIWTYHRKTQQGKLKHRLLGHVGPVNALDKFDQDHVLSASADGTLKLWNIHSGECIQTYLSTNSALLNNNNTQQQQPESVNGLACLKYDKTNQMIYGGGQDGKLRIWKKGSKNCIATLSGHQGLIRTMDLMKGGKILVTGSYDKSIRVWDIQKQQCLLSIQSGHSSWIFNLMVTRSKIISAGQDHQIMMLDFAHELGLIDD